MAIRWEFIGSLKYLALKGKRVLQQVDLHNKCCSIAADHNYMEQKDGKFLKRTSFINMRQYYLLDQINII